MKPLSKAPGCLAFVALGSNLSNPIQQLHTAIRALEKLPKTSLKRVSPYYRTKPVGGPPQPHYVNAVASFATHLSALDMLAHLQSIENRQGRRRDKNVTCGPRTLDLDLLLWGDAIVKTEALMLPHPRMKERTFVLKPLQAIQPDLIFPTGESLADVWAQLTEDSDDCQCLNVSFESYQDLQTRVLLS